MPAHLPHGTSGSWSTRDPSPDSLEGCKSGRLCKDYGVCLSAFRAPREPDHGSPVDGRCSCQVMKSARWHRLVNLSQRPPTSLSLKSKAGKRSRGLPSLDWHGGCYPCIPRRVPVYGKQSRAAPTVFPEWTERMRGQREGGSRVPGAERGHGEGALLALVLHAGRGGQSPRHSPLGRPPTRSLYPWRQDLQRHGID
jgi:hypothetical protein